MSGADTVPESVAELDDFVKAVRPSLAVNEQTREFIRFLAEGAVDGEPSARERFERWMGVRGSMTLMPDWARELTGLDHGAPGADLLSRRLERIKADLVRWAYPSPPCYEMAMARAGG